MLAPRIAAAQQTQQPIAIGGSAIPGRSYPSPTYTAGFAALNDGDYKNASDLFKRELSGSYRFGAVHWVDSICGYTMLGESEYRMGHYTEALEAYKAALQLYVQFDSWMLNVQFPPDSSIAPAANFRGAPWGHTTRGSRPAHIPPTMPVMIGMNGQQVFNMLQAQRGGTIIPQQAVLLQVSEIVRCTCLAIERRRELLGPLGTLDPLTDEVMKKASTRAGRVNHWSEVWVDAQQGMAYAAAGKTAQAKNILQRSLTMAQGQLDHPLTGLTLLVLGKLSLEEGDYKTAGNYFEEATYSAFDYDDMSVLEEAFRNLLVAHLMLGDAAILDKPLATAIEWYHSHSRESRELEASLLLLASENLALHGQTAPAATLLAEATGVIGRHLMAACEIGARLSWLTALTQYQRGTAGVPAGDEALKRTLDWEREGSRWLYLIGLADNSCVINPNGKFPLPVASELYAKLLRDPTPADWGLDPLESLGVISTPHPQPYEHWFEKIVSESSSLDGASDQALEVADLTRRHRFLSSLPLGGRLMTLRWILQAPEESLDKDARLQRQELLTKYSKYVEAATKVKQLTAEISQTGLNLQSRDAATRAAESKLSEVASLSAMQEAILHEIAVGRAAADVVFPPVRKTKQLQQSLPQNCLLLAYFNTSRASFGWLFSTDRSKMWKLDNSSALEKRLATFLKALGNFDSNHELSDTQLEDAGWKQAAVDLTTSLLWNAKSEFRPEYKELVIVPDGLMWYVPFEALPVGDLKENRPLISRLRVRYVPTTGLAMSLRQGRKGSLDLGVALDKLYPSASPEFTQMAMDEIGRGAGRVMALKNPLPVASPLLGAVTDGLIAIDDIPASQGPYDWSPVPLDKGKSGANSFAAWMSLPWKSTDVFVLPSFHTPAESSLKTAGASLGNDLFLTTMGILSTGARTALISRWRTGGQSMIDLVHEFIQELPQTPADEAWQRAVELVSQAPVDFSHEPRIKRKADGAAINAEHPFFWAGYLLVDTGAAPRAADQGEHKPLLKIDMKLPPDKKSDDKAPAATPPPIPKSAELKPDNTMPEGGAKPMEAKPTTAAGQANPANT